VKKGKQVTYANPLTASEKEQMKAMDTMRGSGRGLWTEARLQYEISRGEQGDLNFIKARHGPRAQGSPALPSPR